MPAPAPPQAPTTPPNTALVAAPVDHYENFPVASFLCPAHLRQPIAAIYHFARTADDLADEGDSPAGVRLQDLADYRVQLSLASVEQTMVAWDPRWAAVFGPLQAAIARYQLPVNLLHDLLDAFVQDVENTRDASTYATDAALLGYCRLSANPVGRLLLHLYGVTDAQALAQSDAICSALQLINFWQDPSVDLPRGRYYFSDEARARHGVPLADMKACRQTPAMAQMLQRYVQDARALMFAGQPLVHRLGGRAGWELRLVVQGGLHILQRIEDQQFTTLQSRPTLRRWDYAAMLWRALWM